jgi:hypothetical protein
VGNVSVSSDSDDSDDSDREDERRRKKDRVVKASANTSLKQD